MAFIMRLNTTIDQMKRVVLAFSKQGTFIFILISTLIILCIIQWSFHGILAFTNISVFRNSYLSNSLIGKGTLLYRRQSCSCTRSLIKQNSDVLIIDETMSSLCSQYSTLRGFHQRIISISMYGPRDNSLFTLNTSLNLLHELTGDMTKRYPGWILRIYHDATIKDDVICPIECAYHHVDFCNASSLGNFGSVSSYMPAKIWRFLPVGDELVDIMASRDLDSPIVQREVDAVNDWISSGKVWHAMRDHPQHSVPMLGGMWGCRPSLNRTFAAHVLRKILDQPLVNQYGGRGDQRFLTDHVWPSVQEQIIVHDSFLCTSFGKHAQAWPTRRLHPSNESGCFVGCPRPCCDTAKYAFGECPMVCRPKNHTDWTMC